MPPRGDAEALRLLTHPRSVAVIGATDQPGKLGANLLRNLQSFPGEVHYINPRRSEVLGRRAHAHIGAVGAPIDLALVLIPVEHVESAVAQCAEAGVRVAALLSAGFHELGEAGHALKRRIRELARARGLRLLGPNCTGVLNTSLPLPACFLVMPPVAPGRVGLFGQSGTLLGGLLWDYCELDRLGLAQVVTLGDKLDLGEMDVLEHFLECEEIGVAAGYVEALDDAPAFLSLCRRFTRAKPLLLLRGGTTEAGVRAAWSHTGRIVRSGAVLDEQLSAAGVVQVLDFASLLGAAAAFEHLARFPGAKRRAAIATTSGAGGVVLVDQMARAGLAVSVLEPATVREVASRGLAGPDFTPTEQIDLELPGERFGITRAVCDAIEVLANDPGVDVVLLAIAALGHFEDLDAEAVAAAARRAAKPVFAWLYGRNDLKIAWRRGFGREIRVCADLESMVRPIASYERWRRRDGAASESIATGETRAPEAGAVAGTIDEAGLRDRLARWRLPFVEARAAARVSEVEAAAAAIGYPVALKHLHSERSHKSEHGLVALGIRDAGELRAAAERMDAGGTWLVQAMVADAIEAFVGVSRDAALGPMIAVGLGGVLVELIGDVATAPAPLDEPAARALIAHTRLARLLAGYRGRPPGDEDALAALLATVSRIAIEWPELEELDLNPVMVRAPGRGVALVDARARVRAI